VDIALLAVVVLATSALLVLLLAAAWSRFIDPDDWLVDSRWAARPRLAAGLDRVLGRFDPLRSFILLLVLTGLVLAFAAVPTVAVLLGKL
jgi:hypothetical protein